MSGCRHSPVQSRILYGVTFLSTLMLNMNTLAGHNHNMANCPIPYPFLQCPVLSEPYHVTLLTCRLKGI